MSSGLPSDEVAEDYKNSLEDLTTNDKFQISNLTVIAKENTEHAMAISRVLENHIRTVGACPSSIECVCLCLCICVYVLDLLCAS
jgi:pre-mRNA cleavage complex 2 protein Pcf11